MEFLAGASILILRENDARAVVRSFIPRRNKEVSLLIAIHPSELNQDLLQLLPKKIRSLCKKKNLQVNADYWINHIRANESLYEELTRIPKTHVIILQITMPNKQWRDVFISVSSNGKRDYVHDLSIVDCVIRETAEEIKLKLYKHDFCGRHQLKQRNKTGCVGLPLTITYDQSLCYILYI